MLWVWWKGARIQKDRWMDNKREWLLHRCLLGTEPKAATRSWARLAPFSSPTALLSPWKPLLDNSPAPSTAPGQRHDVGERMEAVMSNVTPRRTWAGDASSGEQSCSLR